MQNIYLWTQNKISDDNFTSSGISSCICYFCSHKHMQSQTNTQGKKKQEMIRFGKILSANLFFSDCCITIVGCGAAMNILETLVGWVAGVAGVADIAME